MKTKKKTTAKQCWSMQAKGKTADIFIYEEIGEFGISANAFSEDLLALGDVETLNVRINCPGGSVYQGLAIYNALKRHPAYVNIFIDGIALSMGGYIAMAGDTVTMAENGLFMIHAPETDAYGNSSEIARTLDLLQKSGSQMVSAYCEKSGRSINEITALMNADDGSNWLTAEQALELGLIDAIAEPQKMVANFSLDSVSVPARLRDVFCSVLTPQESSQMATKTPAGDDKKVVAKLSELEQLKGSDDSFVVACLREGLTLEDAKTKLLDSVVSKLADRDKELTALRPDQKAMDASGVVDTSQDADDDDAADGAGAGGSGQGGSGIDAPDPSGHSQAVGNRPVRSNLDSNPDASLMKTSPVALMRRARAEARVDLMANGSQKRITPTHIFNWVDERYPGLMARIQEMPRDEVAAAMRG